MQRVKISEDGPQLSQFIYGCWRLCDDPAGSDPATVLAKIDACLEHGVTSFDHADIYGGYRCEKVFGDAIAERPALRDQVEVITKCDIALVDKARPGHRVKHYNTSRDHVIMSAERSLKNLRVDTLDALLLHRPDPLMNADQTADALTRLRDAGKIRHAGVSNFTPGQFDLLQSRLDFPLVTNQVEISVLHTDLLFDGSLDHAQHHRYRPMAWSPTGRGKLFTGEGDRASRTRDALQRIGGDYDASLDQMAFAWILRLPSGPLPIIGTNKPQRIASAIGAAAISLERQHWFEILEASIGHEAP